MERFGKRLKPWMVIPLLVLALGGGVGAIVLKAQKGPKLDLDKLTVVAKTEALQLKVTASGTIEPIRSVNISPKNSGRLVELYVEQGDSVSAGQLLARMENRDISAQRTQAQGRIAQIQAKLQELAAGDSNRDNDIAASRVDQARSDLAAAESRLGEAVAAATNTSGERSQVRAGIAENQAQFDEAQATLRLARSQFKRNQKLEADGAISRDRLDELQAAVLRAEAAAARTQATVSRGGAAVDRLEANIAAAQARVRQAEISVSQARARLQQSQLELDRSRAPKRPEQLDQVRAELVQAQGQLQAIDVQQGDTEIRAPFAGTITQRYAQPGAFVTPTTAASSTASATSTSIVAIAEGIEVIANIPEVDVDQIKLGQPVEILVDAYPDRPFQGKVRLIAPAAIKEQNVTSFQIRVSVLDSKLLRSGMNADLTFIGGKTASSLVVPTVAIITREGETGVILSAEGEPKFQSVTIGTTVDNQTQILKGLGENDRVFIDIPPNDARFKPFQAATP
jgi:HlyD family secretion protein